MKLYTKIFLSFFILIAAAFCLCGTWMISASFDAAKKREIQMGMSRNELYRTTFRSAADSVPADYFTTHHSLREIVVALKDGMDDKNGAFCLYDENKNIVYSTIEEKQDVALLEKVDKQHKAYKIEEKDGKYTLRVVSYMMLSYFLTYRIRGLSLSARAFADGDMDRRALVRGKDEVAVLSADFNQMADSLQEKMQELEEHAKSQEAFTAAFAHELIRSMALSKEEEMTAADYIYSQGKRLESLSYKLLDLFVLQQGQKPESPVKMEKVGEETKEIMAPVLAKKQQRLTLWMEPFTLTGEKDLLISLLCNLIDNARKASGEGKKITVRGTKEEDGYQLTVADEGKGIPTEEIHKIFAPFYMVDKSRSRKEGGAGLGMSLRAEILRLHGAQWKIESKEGQGTCIYLHFPEKEEP